MAEPTRPRPDLAAHARAMRLGFPELASELRVLLGARLVAYLGGVGETRAVHEWAEGARCPSEATRRRLRLAHQLAATIEALDGREVAQAWMAGLNPALSDRSPARLLREGDLDEVGPALVGAARAFLVG